MTDKPQREMTESEMPKLKPCPFCSKDAEFRPKVNPVVAVRHACHVGQLYSSVTEWNARPDLAEKPNGVHKMNDEQIKYMRDRFLVWAIPVEGFHPDGGISFEPIGSKGTPHEFKREPSGTNVFNAEQAEQMIRFMLDGCNAEKPAPDKDVTVFTDKDRADYAAYIKNQSREDVEGAVAYLTSVKLNKYEIRKHVNILIRAAQATKTNCKLETIMLLTDEPFPPTPNVVARPVYAHVWPKPDKEYEYIVREKK
jgi:hypothetical protein